jgi:hypothetical protein
LYAQRIYDEFVTALVIAKCVQEKRNCVVAQNVFALGHVRADLVRLVRTYKDCIEILVVITQVYGGRLAYRVSVAGIALAQPGYFYEIRPPVLAQEFLEHWRARNSGHR